MQTKQAALQWFGRALAVAGIAVALAGGPVLAEGTVGDRPPETVPGLKCNGLRCGIAGGGTVETPDGAAQFSLFATKGSGEAGEAPVAGRVQ